MDDFGTVFLVLVLGNPLALEGGKGREGGTTGPDSVVSIAGGNDLDHTGLWGEGVELSTESVWKSFVKGGSSGKDDVLVEVLSDVNIAILDGGISHLVHTEGLVSFLDEAWVEDGLWGEESWGVYVHGGTIWKLIDFLELGGAGSLGGVLSKVLRDEAVLLLDGSNNLLPG